MKEPKCRYEIDPAFVYRGPLRVSIERLTTEQLRAAVACHNPRGKVSSPRVDEYARRMAKPGLWDWENGDPIRFNQQGQLIDGFHRISAALKLGLEPFWVVVREVPKGDTIDQGWRRLIAQLLTGENLKNPATLAAATRIIMAYQQGVRSLDSMVVETNVNLDNSEWMDSVSQLSLDTMVASAADAANSPASKGVAAAVFYLIRASRHPRGEAFIRRFCEGTDLTANCPVLAARKHFLGEMRYAHQGWRGRAYAFAMLAKAWAAFRDQRPMQALRIGRTEPIVEI
jgi:hypothetical protein